MTIQKMCKEFREKILNKTLQQMSNETGINLKTISSFENGRSNNLNHIHLYVNSCDNDLEIITFFHNLENILKGGRNE